MKFQIKIDTDKDGANVIGEALRQKFWDPKKGYGCYENFDWAYGVEELPDEIEERVEVWDGESWHDQIVWHRAKWEGILCRYFWDGDGYLEFSLPDGTTFYNSDCKKDYGWKYRNAKET